MYLIRGGFLEEIVFRSRLKRRQGMPVGGKNFNVSESNVQNLGERQKERGGGERGGTAATGDLGGVCLFL